MGCCSSEQYIAPRVKSWFQTGIFSISYPKDARDPVRSIEGGTCTSTAVDKAQASDAASLKWSLRAWLVPHEPLRHELMRVSYVLQNFDSEHPQEHQWAAVCHYFQDFFAPVLKDHHTNEETIAKPMIEEYFKKHNKSLDDLPLGKFTTDHHSIDEMMTDLDKQAGAFLGLPSPKKNDIVKAHAAFTETWGKLHALLLDHLEEEEKKWPAVLEQMPEDDWMEIQNAIMKSGEKCPAFAALFGAVHNAMLVWNSKAGYQSFMTALPEPVLGMVPFMISQYQYRVTQLFSALSDDEFTEPAPSLGAEGDAAAAAASQQAPPIEQQQQQDAPTDGADNTDAGGDVAAAEE